MTAVTTWTGREANALRIALRMSLAEFAQHLGAARRTVAKWSSRGQDIQLRHEMQTALDTVLTRAPADARERFEALILQPTDVSSSMQPIEIVDGDVRRRDIFPFVAVAADSAVTAILDDLLSRSITEPDCPVPSLAELKTRLAEVKGSYQACRYDRVPIELSALLPALARFESAAAEPGLTTMRVLAADAYHVVGSVLLKLDDPAMALVAAERSTRYAETSGDPVAAGTAARVMTHALMNNGHARRAVSHAARAARILQDNTRLGSEEAVAVHGALVLRGAIAAARSDDRDSAEALLDEASRSADRLGHDGNTRWTGFGPTNVLLHRVDVALTCGDAGSAIALARQVPLDKVLLAERRARLFVDVATAYTRWGRYGQALASLRMADRIAPQEVRHRSPVRRVIRDLAALAQGPVRSQVHAFALTAGISV